MSGRTYGNVQAPRRARTLGLSAASVACVLTGAVLLFVLVQLGVSIFFAALVFVPVLVGVWLVESGRRHGRTRLERWLAVRFFRRSVRIGASEYRSGPSSAVPDGTFRAPGLLAATEMFEGVDHLGRPFAFLWDRMKKTGTVFFSAASSGRALQDQDTVDRLVAGWGTSLYSAGTLAAVEQVAVTCSSVRDTGERLPAAVADARAEVADRSAVSGVVVTAVDQIVDQTNFSQGRLDVRVAVTFSGLADEAAGLDARGREELQGEVMAHLPAMVEQLEGAGGGVVSYLDAQDVIDATFVAYNPSQAVSVERARLSGAGTGLRWEEVGPAAASARFDRYEHAGAFSKSFQVWQAPAGVFRENSLEAVLSPDGESEIKRVTVLYRPLKPEASQKRVQTAVTDADYEVNQKGRKTPGVVLVARDRAARTEAEVSEGAVLVRFSFVITVTVAEEKDLRTVPGRVRNACQTGVQLSVRGADGNEDAAFAIGLGLGVVPARWATLSSQLREAL